MCANLHRTPFSGLGETAVKLDIKRQTWPNFNILDVSYSGKFPILCPAKVFWAQRIISVELEHFIQFKNFELPKCPPGLLIKQTIFGLSA